MSGGGDRPRSFDTFQTEDLKFLLETALEDLRDFESRHTRHLGLGSTLICVTLCQGAAKHLVQGEGGVHDFDVWSFFRADAARPSFPARRRVTRPFEGPRFQKSSRRIDLLGRTIVDHASVSASLTAYLRARRTVSARALATRPVFILYPPSDRGPLEMDAPTPGQSRVDRGRPSPTSVR